MPGIRPLGGPNKRRAAKEREIQMEIQNRLVEMQLRCNELEQENAKLKQQMDGHVALAKVLQRERAKTLEKIAKAGSSDPRQQMGKNVFGTNKKTGKRRGSNGGGSPPPSSATAAAGSTRPRAPSIDDGYKSDSEESTEYSDTEEEDTENNSPRTESSERFFDDESGSSSLDVGPGDEDTMSPRRGGKARAFSVDGAGSERGHESHKARRVKSPRIRRGSSSRGISVRKLSLNMSPPAQDDFSDEDEADKAAALIFQRTPSRSPRDRDDPAMKRALGSTHSSSTSSPSRRLSGADTAAAAAAAAAFAEQQHGSLGTEDDLEEALSDAPTDVIRVLSHTPLLKSVSRSDLQRLASTVTVKSFSDGDVVIRQGDVGDCMYIIYRGKARVTIGSGSSKDSTDPADGIEVRQLGDGACFGEKALLEDVPRTANILAIGELQCIVVPRDMFIRLQQKIASDAARAASEYMMFKDALQWRINQTKEIVSASMDKPSYLAAIQKSRELICSTEWPFPCDFRRLLANMAPRHGKGAAQKANAEGYDSEQFCAACNQAWKDLRRENDVRINGETMRMGSDEASESLRARLRVLLEQSRRAHIAHEQGTDDDSGLLEGDPVGDALDVLFLVMSRTMHGGDTHAKTAQVFGNQDLILITPNSDTPATIHIDVGPEGTLLVTSLNAYKINYMGENIEVLFNVDARLVERLHCCVTGGGMYTQQRTIKFDIVPMDGWKAHQADSGSGTRSDRDDEGADNDDHPASDQFSDSDDDCETLTLVVPPGKRGGDDIILIRDGKRMTATIPEGLVPGDEFDLMLRLSPEKRRHAGGI